MTANPNAVEGLLSSEGDWTVVDCPGCGRCVTYSKKAASSKEAYRDLLAEVQTLRAALGQCEFALRTLLPNDADAALSARMARAALRPATETAAL